MEAVQGAGRVARRAAEVARWMRFILGEVVDGELDEDQDEPSVASPAGRTRASSLKPDSTLDKSPIPKLAGPRLSRRRPKARATSAPAPVRTSSGTSLAQSTPANLSNVGVPPVDGHRAEPGGEQVSEPGPSAAAATPPGRQQWPKRPANEGTAADRQAVPLLAVCQSCAGQG